MFAIQIIIHTLAPVMGLQKHPVAFRTIQFGCRAVFHLGLVSIVIGVFVMQRIVGHLTIQIIHRRLYVSYFYTFARRLLCNFCKDAMPFL